MIVITGVGRSGTSFLARLYRELGFDPGGRWLPTMRAGYEDDEVVEANELVAHDLGVRFLAGPSPDRFDMIEPGRVASTVKRHGERLRTIAGEHVVVKDPRFCWTMPVWLQARAAIEHVVLSTRSMDAVIASRRAAGHLRFRTEAAAMNELVYAIGVCMTAIADHDVPHTIVRFPHVLDCPEELAARLPFPDRIDPDAVIGAVRTVARRDLVHDWR